MRLLLFNLATDIDDPALGFTARWIVALAKRVERIYVITMRQGHVAAMPDNVWLYSVGKEKGYSEPRRLVEFYQRLLAILRHDRIDMCFSHMAQIFTVLGAPILKCKGIPLVTWYAHPSLPWTVKLAHHLSDRMVTSVATAYPYKHEKLTVVGQGIDVDLFTALAAPPAEPPTILCVGRLSPVKDHLTLLKAAALLRERWKKPFHVVIVGGAASSADAAYVQSLHTHVQRLSLQDVVRFQPPAPLTHLPWWYQHCTMHVNLTPTGFGDKVAWEAMACARPCLVANEGFRETLGQYTGSLLFRYGDAADLAQHLVALLALSPTERAAMGDYLRERVVDLHSLDRLARRLVEVFAEIQEGRCGVL
jgi:glycosyltransferase involved in cell wall biosynthesis